MSRYIDADTLQKNVRIRFMENYHDGFGIVDIADIIDGQPTVDAVPVVHGYNKQFKFPSQFTCSVCGWESWDTYCGDTDTYNYCPHCGAKMDGADGEREDNEH